MDKRKRYFYKLTISYDGSRYDGWQRQGNTKNTIQQCIEEKLEVLLGEKINLTGAGRTDAGVHAAGQTANFGTNKEMKDMDLKRRLNVLLPADIKVMQAERVSNRFHSRHDAVAKIYQYRVTADERCSVFQRNYVYALGKRPDAAAMRKASGYLLGTHDFRSFTSEKDEQKSAVRTIYDIKIEELEKEIRFTFYGNGFLYHMVRILSGTLLEVGMGKRAAEDIASVLKAKTRKAAGATAPAKGLCLMEVLYRQPYVTENRVNNNSSIIRCEEAKKK